MQESPFAAEKKDLIAFLGPCKQIWLHFLEAYATVCCVSQNVVNTRHLGWYVAAMLFPMLLLSSHLLRWSTRAIVGVDRP